MTNVTNIIRRAAFLKFCVLAIALAAALTACQKDNSSPGDPSAVGEIVIADLPDVDVVAYTGIPLTVTPEVKATYTEDDLTYNWYLIKGNDDQYNGFRQNPIGEGKTLNYDVKLGSGTYTVVLEVKAKSNGYGQIKSFALNVSTEFSKGFYILKAMGDGTSELDLMTDTSESHDLLTKLSGAPLDGEPVSLAMIYMQSYINEDNDEMETTKMLNVFTTKEYRAYRVEDLKQTFSQKTISFAGEDTGDKYYNIVQGFFTGYLLCSGGIGVLDMGGYSPSSGKIGMPVFGSASRFMQVAGSGMTGYFYWNEAEHVIYSTDYNGIDAFPADYDTSTMDIKSQECIASGINKVGGVETLWFIADESSTHTRWLYLINGSSAAVTIKKLDTSLHASKATALAACGAKAAIIYVIDGGKLYAYSWTQDTEWEVPTPGIPAGETISFVTNQWIASRYYSYKNFDNLIVGTQSGNNYKLYFYNDFTGGNPVSEPFRTISGTGKPKSVRYASQYSIESTDLMMAGSAPTIPTSD